MTLVLLMNLGFAAGPPTAPTFNPAWAANANARIGPTQQPVTK